MRTWNKLLKAYRFLPILGAVALSLFTMACIQESASTLQTEVIRDESGAFQLLRDGEVLRIQGAGGTRYLETLSELGGNTLRTWGVDELERNIDGVPFLDYAHAKGFLVVAGIWVQHERHGFDYRDPVQVEEQREQVRAAVEAYRDHPAILLWGLGNEVEAFRADDDDTHVWQEWNELAKIVKELDPSRPVMATVAGVTSEKIEKVQRYGDGFDILGVNAYAGAIVTGSLLKEAGFDRPFVLAEFGPRGHWEVPVTDWGAPIEASGNEKAEHYLETYQTVIEDAGDLCIGSFVFLWGHKQEMTRTWYGMFLESGEKLPAVDAMAFAWTGGYPETRCPELVSVRFDAHLQRVSPKSLWRAEAEVVDPQGQSLRFQWEIISEQSDPSIGGDRESVPTSHPSAIRESNGPEVLIEAPEAPGAYRLFLTVINESQAATTANFPFKVQ